MGKITNSYVYIYIYISSYIHIYLHLTFNPQLSLQPSVTIPRRILSVQSPAQAWTPQLSSRNLALSLRKLFSPSTSKLLSSSTLTPNLNRTFLVLASFSHLQQPFSAARLSSPTSAQQQRLCPTPL